jgi:MFS family permease
MNGMFRALGVRNYRLFASGQLVSNTGTWMGRVTQDWLVYHILTHDSSFALGVVTALQFLPTLVLGMYGGVLGDRYSKRSLLIGTQSALGALSLLSGVLISTHVMTLSIMSAIALAFGVASAIDVPIRQAFVVEMVGRDMLQNAVSLNSATFNASRMIGPAVAGVLIEAVGTAPAFYFNAASYLAVIAGMLLMSVRELHVLARSGRSGGLREGLAYVRSRPQLWLPIVLIGVVGTFGFNFQITNALVAQGIFHRGAGSYGILSTAQAAGALAGALTAARRRRRPRMLLLLGAAAGFSALEAVSGFIPIYVGFLVTLIPIGGMGILLATSCNAAVQLNTEPHMQGRVMAVYTTAFMGCAPIGSLIVGWLGSALGPEWALFFGGTTCLVATVGCAFYYARAHNIELRVGSRLRWRREITADELARESLAADVAAR